MKQTYLRVSKVVILFMIVLLGCHTDDVQPSNKGESQTTRARATMAEDPNAIVVFDGNALYRVDEVTMQASQLPYGWAGTTASTISKGFLFAIQNGTLYKFNLSTHDIWDFGHYWDGTELLTSDDAGNIYAIQGAKLYRINPNNGSWTELALYCDWTSSTEMGYSNVTGYLYIWQYGNLWRVNRTTGYCEDYGANSLGPLIIPDKTYHNTASAYGISSEGIVRTQGLGTANYTDWPPALWTGATDVAFSPNGSWTYLWIIKDSQVHKVELIPGWGGDYHVNDLGTVPGLTNAYKISSKYGR